MAQKNSLYWACQIGGWGTVVLFWFYYEIRDHGPGAMLWLILLEGVGQILVTDAYRRLAHRRGWLKLPVLRLLPVASLAWLLLVAQYLLMAYLVFKLRYSGCFCGDVLLGVVSGGVRYHAIWLLAFHLYHFARHSAATEAEAARQAQLATEARLAKLNAELNPHFLFNALTGIKALTREDPARSRAAIDRLAELLRYALRQSDQPTVPLAEEIATVESYLALEKMRLEDRLQVNWALPPSLDPFRLPPMALHTLVENAVKHGITHLPDGGTISILLHDKRSTWSLEVQNDGRFQVLQHQGTGLRNLRQRLTLHYGESASLEIGPGPAPETTVAQLIFPSSV
ncbi:histidine kinase [Neolewinella lacunae]|uniref:Histidine kinase n=1 Tax=Neolewinella lacunae TaxID=1517758 RepID=A0A923PM82_9BACT|nr:histidine kinase [Neolewinella lacunae]MBC6996743.1 histidine kinase [Neolewinella lacunae]MDN3633392.1 histidine kinase [Neolewinella lacunae]